MQILKTYLYLTRFRLVKKKYEYFIGYFSDNYKIKPLHKLPKTSAYVKSYDGPTKWMYFLIKDDDLLKKYNTIWDKVNADIKKELDSKPVYIKKFLKTKIKSCSDQAKDFHDEKAVMVGSNYTCLAVISLDSTLKKIGVIIRKGCKYIEKVKKEKK